MMHLPSLQFIKSTNRTIASSPLHLLDNIASLMFQLYYRNIYHMYNTLQSTKSLEVNRMKRSYQLAVHKHVTMGDSQ